MFPVSDVIPSRRTTVVTIGLIVFNAGVFVYEVLVSRKLSVFGMKSDGSLVPSGAMSAMGGGGGCCGGGCGCH